MKIFPAIDIKDKKCVRLIKGDFENKTEYVTSPIDQAEKFKIEASIMHVADNIAEGSFLGSSGQIKSQPLNTQVWKNLGLPDNLLTSIYDEMYETFEETVEIFT